MQRVSNLLNEADNNIDLRVFDHRPDFAKDITIPRQCRLVIQPEQFAALRIARSDPRTEIDPLRVAAEKCLGKDNQIGARRLRFCKPVFKPVQRFGCVKQNGGCLHCRD